ncbi:hypothetical protein BJ742DRAFT_772328 [Cladochytrium replicatum]|nr:hypothetical protein BJ742DRAFT_772328 [Cladochytrium replicatum]
MGSTAQQRFDVASRGADNFVKLYYSTFDSNRIQLQQLYRDSSVILWNGNPFQGGTPYMEFCQKLPASDHKLSSYDSQPIAMKDKDVLVNVNGAVRYGTESFRQFCHTFILTPDPENMTSRGYVIGMESFRLVS